MFSPFVTPYLKMMQATGMLPGMGGSTASDMPTDTSSDTPGLAALLPVMLAARQHRQQAQQPPQQHDTSHEGLNAGLVALGTNLAAHAGTNDWASGIASGIAGFAKARQDAKDAAEATAAAQAEQELKAAANARAEHADARAAQEQMDRHNQAGLSMKVDQAKFDTYQRDQQRGEQLRATTGKNAAQMVEDINTVAASHPEDPTLALMSHRALGYSLGDDSDLNKLAGLHAEIVARAGRTVDAAFDTKSKIDQVVAEKGAGFGPLVEAGQGAARLSLEQRHEAAYEKEIGNKTANSLTYTSISKPAGWYDDVDKEIGRMIGPTIESRAKQAGKTDMITLSSPEYQKAAEESRAAGKPPPPIPTVQPMSPAEIEHLRRQVESTAVDNVNRRYGLYPGPQRGESQSAAGSMPRRPHMIYDPRTGKLIPDISGLTGTGSGVR